MTGMRLSDCACGRWAVDHTRPGDDPKLRLNKGARVQRSHQNGLSLDVKGL